MSSDNSVAETLSPSARTNPYGIYDQNSVRTWEAIAQRQAQRDHLYWPALAKLLRPGSVLELGAACGQVSLILKNRGFSVVASDYQPFFVDHMKSKGLRAIVADATKLTEFTDEKFDNVIAQSLTTQMRRIPEQVEATYRSVHAALKPGGIFLSTCAHYFSPLLNYHRNIAEKRALYLNHQEQLDVIRDMKLFTVLRQFRYQILPNSLYIPVAAPLLNWIDFTVPALLPPLGVRSIFLLQRS